MTTALVDHLQRIYDERGTLTPDLVVSEASAEDHPLHNRFEWDNAVAGPKYREGQASELIRSVQIVFAEDENGMERKVRAFHSVNRVDGPSYVPIAEVRTDEFMSKLVLLAAHREWKAFYRKYSNLTDFMQGIREQIEGAAS